MQTSLGADHAQAPDLGQHFREEGLAAESRIHGHHQDDIAEMEDIFDELRRARGIQHHPCPLSEISDLGERPMQMDRGAGLSLDQQVIRPRFGKDAEVALRLDHHEMHIERLRRRAPDRLQHDRPNGDIGHEAAIHHIHMDPVGAGRIDRADLLAQAREIRR